MNRSKTYRNTHVFMKGRWIRIIAMIALISLISNSLNLLFGTNWIYNLYVIFNHATVNTDPILVLNQIDASLNTVSFVSLSIDLVSKLFMAGLVCTVYTSYKTESRIHFKLFIQTLRSNFFNLLSLVLILTSVSMLIGLIPVIGPLLNIGFDLLSAFAIFILMDHPETNAIYAILKSIEETKGKKWDLCVIATHYMIRPLLFCVITIVGSLILGSNSGLSSLILLSGFTITSILSIAYAPYLISSRCIYYCETYQLSIQTEILVSAH